MLNMDERELRQQLANDSLMQDYQQSLDLRTQEAAMSVKRVLQHGSRQEKRAYIGAYISLSFLHLPSHIFPTLALGDIDREVFIYASGQYYKATGEWLPIDDTTESNRASYLRLAATDAADELLIIYPEDGSGRVLPYTREPEEELD